MQRPWWCPLCCTCCAEQKINNKNRVTWSQPYINQTSHTTQLVGHLMYGQTSTELHKHIDTQKHKHPKTQTPKHPNTQTPKHPNTQTPKHPNTQTPKHTNTQTHTYTCIHVCMFPYFSYLFTHLKVFFMHVIIAGVWSMILFCEECETPVSWNSLSDFKFTWTGRVGLRYWIYIWGSLGSVEKRWTLSGSGGTDSRYQTCSLSTLVKRKKFINILIYNNVNVCISRSFTMLCELHNTAQYAIC